MRTRSSVVAFAIALACATAVLFSAVVASEPDTGWVAGPLSPDFYECPPTLNTDLDEAHEIVDGTLAFPSFDPVEVGTDIDWSVDPFEDRNWRWRLHNLLYVRQVLLVGREQSSRELLDGAERILRDWVADNPVDAPPSDFSWDPHATALRAQVLACAAVVLGDEPWLRHALAVHGEVLADPEFYQGDWNHGFDQNRGLLAAGCLLGRSDWIREAEQRTNSILEVALDEQGATNEQAVGYARVAYELYTEYEEQLQQCARDVPALLQRRLLVPEFLAHATLPDGTYVPLGDTVRRSAVIIRSTPAEYAATLGERGPHPRGRTAVYARGYVFGRSGWGDDRPVDEESFYALRFGPGRQIHGHRDHTAIYWYAQGRPILVEAGFGGYGKADDYRDYTRLEYAHNVVVSDDAGKFLWEEETTLLSAVTSDDADSYTFVDRPYAGVERRRDVLVSFDPDVVVVRDVLDSDAQFEYRQLWHLAPELSAEEDGRGGATAVGEGVEVRLAQVVEVGEVEIVSGREAPLQGWISEGPRDRRPAPVVEFESKGKTVEFLTVIAAGPDVSEIEVTRRDEGDLRCLDVAVGKAKLAVVADPEGLRAASCPAG